MYPLLFLFFAAFSPSQNMLPTMLQLDEQERLNTAQDFSPVQFEMEFETEKKGKRLDKESGNYSMVFSDTRYAMLTGTSNSESQVIMDVAARTITTVTTDKDGSVIAVKMPMIGIKKNLFDDLVQEVERTGETRKILGYDTRKYIITSNGDVTESWIANVPGLAWGDFAKSIVGSKNITSNGGMLTMINDMPNAFSLESHTTVKGGKKVVHAYVRKLALGADADLSALEIPTGAEVQDMTSLMKF